MKKKEAKTIAVSVTRVGSDPIALTVAVGTTVADAIAQASIALPGNAELYVSGVRADEHDELEDRDNVTIVTPKQAGR